jgi:hypothetical protein
MKVTLLKFSDPKKEQEFNEQIENYSGALIGYFLSFYLVGRLLENDKLKDKIYEKFTFFKSKEFSEFFLNLEDMMRKDGEEILSTESLKSINLLTKTIIGTFINFYQILLKENAQINYLDIDESILELLSEGGTDGAEEMKGILEKMTITKAIVA